MSRLWNNRRLRVYLGSGHLAACLVSGQGRRRELVHKAIIPLAAADDVAVATALEGWMLAHGRPAGMDIQITLGTPHVRYLLLPWNESLVQREVRLAAARALFSRQFQEDAGLFEARFANPVYQHPQLVVFVSKALLQGFTRVADRHNVRLSRIEPLLAALWAQFSRRLGHSSGHLLVAESDRLLAIRREKGGIADIYVRPCNDSDFFEQARRLSGEPGLKVFAPRLPALAGALPAEWLGLKEGIGFSPESDRDYAFALCGGW